MDIASDRKFDLEIVHTYPFIRKEAITIFTMDEREIWDPQFPSIQIEEYEDIQVLFNSADANARLYLDALDIIPESSLTFIDDAGEIYRIPSVEPFVLYSGEKGYDALRVDEFEIKVVCYGKVYYSVLKVCPKAMTINEWTIMRSDLESEMIGLAQDIVRRNIGLGERESGYIPPKKLFDFLVIQKYAKSVMGALIDIADNPRYQICNEYDRVTDVKNHQFDKETVKDYVVKSGSGATYIVPKKAINYNILENQILKNIIQDYEERLDDFINMLGGSDRNLEQMNYSVQYRNEWNNALIDFWDKAIHLRRLTGILKSKQWYCNIGNASTPYIPHSLILDSRYNILYQMHRELKKQEFNISFDTKYSYTWKQSSVMYELWSYLKIAHLLMKDYLIAEGCLDSLLRKEDIIFPYLSNGSKLRFKNESVFIDLIFNCVLPSNKNETSLDNPVYIAKRGFDQKVHNHPDILLNVYSVNDNVYLATIILECKYRKLYSFWNENNKRSSIEQFQTYYNNSRSEYQYNGFGKRFRCLPVYKVIVCTPDDDGNNKTQEDYNISIKTFKPTVDGSNLDSMYEDLNRYINEIFNNYQTLPNFFTPQ